MESKKFFRPDQKLRIAVGVTFPEEAPNGHPEGVSDIRVVGDGGVKMYLDLNSGILEQGERYVDRVEIPVPEKLRGAPYGELLFNNNKGGAKVIFARHGENKTFKFTMKQRYIPLRLYPLEKAPSLDWKFKPLFVRVSKITDEGEKTYFFRLDARWKKNVITLEVTRDLKGTEVPGILIGA